MITEDFKVYLIEVNTNPWLETPCSLLARIISSVLDTMICENTLTLIIWMLILNIFYIKLCSLKALKINI